MSTRISDEDTMCWLNKLEDLSTDFKKIEHCQGKKDAIKFETTRKQENWNKIYELSYDLIFSHCCFLFLFRSLAVDFSELDQVSFRLDLVKF